MRTLKLLTVGNPKTAKGTKHGYLSAVLHLAPSNASGVLNTCPRATAGCIAGCLYRAGRAGIIAAGEATNAILECRKRRTRWLVEDPDAFREQLRTDIANHEHNAKELGLCAAVRLNGTSDIDWSLFASATFARVVHDAAERGVRFYDYTKRLDLVRSYAACDFPVHLTFSRAETAANQRDARMAAKHFDCNTAVVFDTGRNAALPELWDGRRVIDGDEHDLRFLDGVSRAVVGLRAKGPARRDTSGFVVRAAD